MTPAQLNTLAREAGMCQVDRLFFTASTHGVMEAHLARFAALVLEEAAKVADHFATRPIARLARERVKLVASDIRALAKQEGGKKL